MYGDQGMLPLDHPEILYLLPNLPGSTPKKPNLIPSQAREGNPELEDMNHQELVDLVKELLKERELVDLHQPIKVKTFLLLDM